jgi:ubiquinone/menaquinone biosynthesis C-methylase UbiE
MPQMSIERPYDEIAAYYDLEHRSFTDDIDLYLQFIEAAGDPVVELGCGTGRILRGIAEAGYSVTGLDSSVPMLDFARMSLSDEGLADQVALIHGDFSDAALLPADSFGVAIIGLDSLLHATALDEQLAVLRAAWRALDPRGQLIVDVLHATPARLMAMDGGLAFNGSWVMSDGARLDKLVSQTIDSAEQLIHSEIWYEVTSTEGAVTRTRTGFTQRWIGSGELLLMLRLAGFQDWRLYGSYELDPLDAHSDRLIVAAEKTKTGKV